MTKIFYIIDVLVIICIAGICLYLTIKRHYNRLKHEHEQKLLFSRQTQCLIKLSDIVRSPYSTIESVKDKPYDLELMTANSSDNKGKKDGK